MPDASPAPHIGGQHHASERMKIQRIKTMNTCEKAWTRLQLHWKLDRTKFQIKIKRRIECAGRFSDGTREITLEPCPSFRWILARDYTGRILAEVDQRDHWDDPDSMNAALNAKLDQLEKAAA